MYIFISLRSNQPSTQIKQNYQFAWISKNEINKALLEFTYTNWDFEGKR